MKSFILFLLLGCVCIVNAQKRPVIGISDVYKNSNNAAVPRSYVDAVLQVGGLPVVIPLMSDRDKIIELLNSLDGVIFTGGEDFDPSYYNEKPIPQLGKVNAPRDKFDINLLHMAVERKIPVLGICRGLQLINIAYGGSLYQDLRAQYHDKSISHRQRQAKEEASHAVIVEDNTVFADIVKDRMLMVNSSHHQAIKKLAAGFRVAGKSNDNIIEAIEKIDSENWILGVQFHPETRVTRDDAMRRIFQRFVDEAERHKKPEKNIITASAPQQQVKQRLDYEPQIVYKSIIDTQYILIPPDTIYIPVAEAQYREKPADTVYVNVTKTKIETVWDTVYIVLSDTFEPELEAYVEHEIEQEAEIKIEPEMEPEVENSSEDVYIVPDSVPTPIILVPDTADVNTVPEVLKPIPDTLVYTPNPTVELPTRKELKRKAKQEKQELKEKELLKNKELKEQAEKEKQKNKEDKEKEKQYQNKQKENAKLDKKDLKEKAKQEKKELKEKEQQAKKEQAEKKKQAKEEAKKNES